MLKASGLGRGCALTYRGVAASRSNRRMGFVARLFGKAPKNPGEQGLSRLQVVTREQTRRELIAMALRDTLKKHGLAVDCIGTDALSGIVVGRQRGMHVQLVFKSWQPGLLAYVVALEQAFKARLGRLDPLSHSWVLGVSWRFACQDPMSWPRLPMAGERKRLDAAPSATTCGRPGVSLEALLQKGDAAFQQPLAAHADFSPTLPMHR